MSRAEAVARALDPEKAKKAGREWVARCPAHNDNNPSLYFKDAPGRENPLFICRAGCEGKDVIRELKARDLWINRFDFGEFHAWQLEQQKAEADYKRLLDGIKAGNGEAAALDYLTDKQPEPYKLASVLQVMGLASELGAEQWNCGPIQAGTVGFIAAKQGVGKSMLALGLAWAMSTGNDFADWAVARPQRVALIDVELNTRFLAKRLALYAWNPETIWLDWQDWREAHSMDYFMLGNTAHHAVLMSACADMDVIIIDNVTFCLDPVRPGELFNPETWNRVKELTDWAKAGEKTIIFIDHTNKSGIVAGSINKSRSADWILLLDGLSEPGANPLEFSMRFDKMRYEADKELTRERMVIGDYGSWRFKVIETQVEHFARLKEAGFDKEQIMDDMGIQKTKFHQLSRAWSIKDKPD